MSGLTVFPQVGPQERVTMAIPPGWLRPPPLRLGVIERPRLAQCLDELAQAPLTIVATPTGYGKTTLLTSWVASTQRRFAWASVGSRDLDVDGFWMLVAAALEQVEPRLCFELRTAEPVGDRAAQMAAALTRLSHELTLILDGYEQAMRVGLDPAFSRFLDLAPEELHVLVSTRCEPALALPLRRVRGTVAELGASDLALDEDEAAAVVQRTSGISPTDVDMADLLERTERWPAAVYLAALVARTEPCPADALARFSGADREISDYLRLELLDTQPDEALRSFLLETSVLERLTAPLCDALLRRRDSAATLRALVRGGAFLVPLGTHEYRYVRPVREFLRAELARVAPERIGDLRRRAAAACERAGLFDEAATHARLATGEEEAASVLARHALEFVREGHTEHLERILATRAGVAAELRRPALRAELRCLARAGSDVRALNKASERVAVLSRGLADGPVRALLETTARAAQAYALYLSGSVAEAYEAGAGAYAAADPDSAAAAAEAAAVASLSASRLGLAAVAAPLARAAAAALLVRNIRSGRAIALALLAEASVAERQGDSYRAEQASAEALGRSEDPPLRALALLQLARLRMAVPEAARATLGEARVELAGCEGAAFLRTLAAELESELVSRERARPATDELSPAEQRVLRLLATRLTQREIANELYVSLNTVKTHTRLIYRKLGVDSRSAAIAAGRALNLV